MLRVTAASDIADTCPSTSEAAAMCKLSLSESSVLAVVGVGVCVGESILRRGGTRQSATRASRLPPLSAYVRIRQPYVSIREREHT